jgi:hypothetical protein
MLQKRTIIICFDNRTWIQETIRVDSLTPPDNIFIENYIKEYEKVKSSIPIMRVIVPSIIHITFLD